MLKSSFLRSALAAAAAVATWPVHAGAGASVEAASAPLAGLLVDANGMAMGPYYPAGPSGAEVLLALGGVPVSVALIATRKVTDPPDTLQPVSSSDNVLFKSRDCTGTPLITARPILLGARPAVVLVVSRSVATVYVASGEAPKQEEVKSFLRVVRHTLECDSTSGAAPMRKVQQIVDLSALFVAPYHLQ